jgi:hypothetical protein
MLNPTPRVELRLRRMLNPTPRVELRLRKMLNPTSRVERRLRKMLNPTSRVELPPKRAGLLSSDVINQRCHPVLGTGSPDGSQKPIQ